MGEGWLQKALPTHTQQAAALASYINRAVRHSVSCLASLCIHPLLKSKLDVQLAVRIKWNDVLENEERVRIN